MDTVVFTEQKVIDYFTNDMVLVKNEAQKEDTALTTRYAIQGFPTLVMVDAKGKEVDRIVGYMPPEDFLKTVNDYTQGIGTLDDLLDSATRITDRPMFYTIAEKYQYRGEKALAKEWYNKVISTGTPTDSISGVTRMLLAEMSATDEGLDVADSAYLAIRKDFKGTELEGQAALERAMMYRQAKEWDKALTAFAEMRKDFKGQKWEADAAWFNCGLFLRKGDTATAVAEYRKMAEEFKNFSDTSYTNKAQRQVETLTPKPDTTTVGSK